MAINFGKSLHAKRWVNGATLRYLADPIAEFFHMPPRVPMPHLIPIIVISLPGGVVMG